LAIAEGFKTSGLAEWIGLQMASLNGVHLIVLLLAIILSVNFLTEVTSNLATTAMILPILAPLALALDVHPFGLLIGATLAASCAFMLPVATPPNAVVFGSGYLKINDMVRSGILFNITSSILLTVFMYYLLPLFLGYDAEVFPLDLKK
jgi:sodium-dependent dicarboxylate transporter 2/3/5